MMWYLAVFLACFTTVLANDRYIIGGDDVTEAGKWPWQGSMRKLGTNGVSSHRCGITLINPSWGLTTAHCVWGVRPYKMSFIFGSNDRELGGIRVRAKRVYIHQRYNNGDGLFSNDIALVEFETEAKGDNIAPIPMAPRDSDHSGNADCWITGWGHTEYNGDLPLILQEANVNVYTDAECKGVWGDSVGVGHLCVGDTENGRTSCSGDIGGPLVCKVNGNFELVGATSWGPAGCVTGTPAAYTRISYYRDWIAEKSGLDF